MVFLLLLLLSRCPGLLPVSIYFSYLSPPAETMLGTARDLYIIIMIIIIVVCMLFFAFTEGDKSTEMSMCKCCDIKNDNGKRLLL